MDQTAPTTPPPAAPLAGLYVTHERMREGTDSIIWAVTPGRPHAPRPMLMRTAENAPLFDAVAALLPGACAQCAALTRELADSEHGPLCARCSHRQAEHDEHGHGLAASTYGFTSETE
jgi:hypothetical protein